MDKYKSVLNFISQKFDNKDIIPLHEPRFFGNERKYINDCIDSSYVSSVGSYVDKFERKISEFVENKYSVVCDNGTNSIHLGLKVLGVINSDEVITQAVTFVATVNAISYIGASPIFMDVDRDSMGMSPEILDDFLKTSTFIKNKECFNKATNKRIKACVPVHTFGHACRIDQIVDICSKYHIDVIEDAAEAMGSYYKGKHLGTFGKIGIVSFNGNKIITTGGGGAILSNDEKIIKKTKHLSTQAKIPHKWEYKHDQVGYNYRMPNINAALGLAQLEQLKDFVKKKRDLAKSYNKFFRKIDLDFFIDRNNEKSNYWLNAIVLKDEKERDLFLDYSNKNGIMCRPIWHLSSNLKMYKKYQKYNLHNSEWLEKRVVNIPSSVI